MMRDGEAYKRHLQDYYNAKVDAYQASYTGAGRYRSNHFRLATVLRLLGSITPTPRTILEAGCGDAHVVAEALKAGYDCKGFDNSEGMLEEGRRRLEGLAFDAERLTFGDIYAIPFPSHSFDVVTCLGVIENLPDHLRIFGELRRVLNETGSLILSLNNELFSLFSMNKFTLEFLDRLFGDISVPGEVREAVIRDIRGWLALEAIDEVSKPIADSEINKADLEIPRYNPLNVREALDRYGFEVCQVRFFHYHPLPPRFEKRYPELFQKFAEGLETTEYDWRGAILCNAMLVEAKVAR